MGKSRRLEKEAKGGHTKVVDRAAVEGGESFYERSGLDLGDQQEVVKVDKDAPRAKRLTARQKKKLQKVVEKKQKNAARAQLIADLQAAQLPTDQLQYMRRTADMGRRKETQKQKLKRELIEEKAGLPVSEDSRLHQKRFRPEDDDSDNGEDQMGSALAGKKPKTSKAAKPGGGGFLAMALATMGDYGLAAGVDNHDDTESESDSGTERDTDDYSDDTSSDEDNGPADNAETAQAALKEAIVNHAETSETPSDDVMQTSLPEAKPAERKPRKAPVPVDERAKAIYVNVVRDPEIQAARLNLPIIGEEQNIMETIRANPVTILCGETGSGKTTQLPQFLYEAGFASGKGEYPGLIAVTEPRRVAAISMSERVGRELNDSSLTGYQIRYAGTVTERTKIKFMTDGVLLKEIERDFLLRKYSAVVIDEAHERSLNTDILIGLLSRIVPLRMQMSKEEGSGVLPIRLIIMSATLRVEDFTQNQRLFPTPPPVIEVASRQYPVTVHFNRRTPHNDYMREAYKKACKIHERLPDGGILVFVTSQQEIGWLCRKLKKRFSNQSAPSKAKAAAKEDSEFDLAKYPVLPGSRAEEPEQIYDVEEEEAAAEAADSALGTGDDDIDGELSEDDSDAEETIRTMGMQPHQKAQPLHVLPLYSMLPQAQQMLVFQPPPAGHRLCVVATNVAETSLTIPNIRYVIDTGKVKVKQHETGASISKFDIEWVAQASADQRAGRAGRTGPGHCYRLFSSAVFNNYFDKFADPEVLRLPIEGLVLQMKAMGIDNVINFPFPTPPENEALSAAEKLLRHLGALDDKGKITPTGKTMSRFPVSPRIAKMLTVAREHPESLQYAVAVCSALTVGNMFVVEADVREEAPEEEGSAGEEQDDEQKKASQKLREKAQRVSLNKMKQRWVANNPQSDLLTMLKAVGAFEFSGGTSEFCEQNMLRYKSMAEIRKLRGQLTNIVNTVFPGVGVYIDPRMPPPNTRLQKHLWRAVLSAYGDQVAKRVDMAGGETALRERRKAYQCDAVDGLVYLHPESALYGEVPDLVVYTEVASGARMLMKTVTKIKPEWLAQLVPAMCTFGKPLEQPAPRYDSKTDSIRCYMSGTFGQRLAWTLPTQELPYPDDDAGKYKVFARALLEGDVFPALRSVVPHLVAKPALMQRAWAQERILVFVAALADNNISSRAALLTKWEEDPRFLLSAYLLWVRASHHNKVAAIWPPIGAGLDGDVQEETEDRDEIMLPSSDESD